MDRGWLWRFSGLLVEFRWRLWTCNQPSKRNKLRKAETNSGRTKSSNKNKGQHRSLCRKRAEFSRTTFFLHCVYGLDFCCTRWLQNLIHVFLSFHSGLCAGRIDMRWLKCTVSKWIFESECLCGWLDECVCMCACACICVCVSTSMFLFLFVITNSLNAALFITRVSVEPL